MTEQRRWDTDTRYVGIADGTPVAGSLRALLEACQEPGWISEDAHAHIGHNLQRACEAANSAWTWQSDAELSDGVYEVRLSYSGEPNSQMWRRAIALLSGIAESSFHVRRVDATTLECVTGMFSGDSEFATHGHTVRLLIDAQT